MDNEIAMQDPVMSSGPKNSAMPSTKTPIAPLSIASSASDVGTAVATTQGLDRNGVFRNLVSDDTDITGLVAYSIYKQNKLDWLGGFEAAKGRAPTDAELSAYIIGEETPRRLATYRHLAEATLAGNGPDVEGGKRPGARRRSGPDRPINPVLIATYIGIAIFVVVGFWLALHFTVASR